MKNIIIKSIYFIGSKIFGSNTKKIIHKYLPKLYYFSVSMRWKTFIKPGDIVVQAGVDMGTKNSIYKSNVQHMLNRVKEKGKVIAIEPSIESVSLLKNHCEKNNITNLLIVEKALWNKRMKLTIKTGKKSWDNQILEVPGAEKIRKELIGVEYQVNADTLDNILESLSIESINHICLTINGAEYEALQGMPKTLNTRNLSMLIASGDSQRFRSHVNGIPLYRKIVTFLERNSFNTFVDKEGWISAFKK